MYIPHEVRERLDRAVEGMDTMNEKLDKIIELLTSLVEATEATP